MKHYLIYLVVTGLLLSCDNNSTSLQEVDIALNSSRVVLGQKQMANAGIVTAFAEQKEVAEILKVNGKIDVPPQNAVSVSVPLGGFLKSTQLLPGMHVKKGEVIAVMEDQQYIQLQQDYLSAKAKIEFLLKEFERQKELNQNKASSDKIFQQAESDYKTGKINLKALYEKLRLIHVDPDLLTEDNLSRTINIPAPINGFVSAVNINVGKYVNPSDILFELVNPDDIHLNLNVYEKDVQKLFIGQKLQAYTNNNPDKRYNCDVLLIGQNISRERNVEVHCHFEAYDKSLIPGMFMNAEIQVTNKSTMVINDEAIVRYEGRDGVFVELSGGEFEWVNVETGISQKGFTEIRKPEDLGKHKIVVKGAYSLLMALKNTEE
jgi:cobalt-zinc-cadmium efflux system membrane fusion protein